MNEFRKALKSGNIDVQELNIHLRSDQELMMDLDENYENDSDSDELMNDQNNLY